MRPNDCSTGSSSSSSDDEMEAHQQRERAARPVADVELQDVAVLTSPNMSGKSTFVRALCAAALLGMSGLCVPARSMEMPHYRLLFLRTACHDIPSKGISSYELEMLDVFTDHYGLYPFVEEKYGMCQVGFGGGMEQSCSSTCRPRTFRWQ